MPRIVPPAPASRTATKPTRSEMRDPCTTRLKTSRPMSSVPNGKNAGSTSPLSPTRVPADHGGSRRFSSTDSSVGLMLIPSGAITSAKTAQSAKRISTTPPAMAAWLRRNRRHAIDHSLRTAAVAIASMEAVSDRGLVVAMAAGTRRAAIRDDTTQDGLVRSGRTASRNAISNSGWQRDGGSRDPACHSSGCARHSCRLAMSSVSHFAPLGPSHPASREFPHRSPRSARV